MNYAGTLGGMIVNCAYNFYFQHNASHVHVATQLSATVPRLIGKAILIRGTLLESAIEAREAGIERRRSWDVKSVDRHAIALSNEIGQLR